MAFSGLCYNCNTRVKVTRGKCAAVQISDEWMSGKDKTAKGRVMAIPDLFARVKAKCNRPFCLNQDFQDFIISRICPNCQG